MRARYGAVSGGVLSDNSCRGDGGGRTVYDAFVVPTVYQVLIPDVTMIYETLPDDNYGDWEWGRVAWATGQHWKTLLYADLSAYNGRTVIAATLNEYDIKGSHAEVFIDCFEMNAAWIEAQATWDDRQTGVPWSAPGLVSGADYLAALLDSVGRTGGTWQSYNVKAAVEQWLSGGRTNYGLLLQWLVVSSNQRELASDDNSTVAWRPYFELTLV